MCIQLTCTHGYLYAFVFIKVCVDCADTHISYWYNLDMSNTWHIFYILIYTVIFIATIFFTFPRQHRFQKSNAKCNTKIYPVLCFSLNRNCAQPINLYRTAEEPEVDWWLWFDCDTFFMNMTATWFKPGNCIRVGREVCSEVRINFTLWRVKYVSIIGGYCTAARMCQDCQWTLRVAFLLTFVQQFCNIVSTLDFWMLPMVLVLHRCVFWNLLLRWPFQQWKQRNIQLSSQRSGQRWVVESTKV